jgi:hypothetical protein
MEPCAPMRSWSHGTKAVALTTSENPEFASAVLKAESAYRAALRAAGLTPMQATDAARKYLEAVITAGTLHEVATPDEIATLRELNRAKIFAT